MSVVYPHQSRPSPRANGTPVWYADALRHLHHNLVQHRRRGVSTAIRGTSPPQRRAMQTSRSSLAAARWCTSAPPPGRYGMTSEANKTGSLVVVGTGIRTVGHLTMEALAWMQRADEIIHLVADPVAEALIAGLKPGKEFTLQGFYGEGKPRAESYNEMIEFILSRVRAGVLVCGAFYGHPACSPIRRTNRSAGRALRVHSLGCSQVFQQKIASLPTSGSIPQSADVSHTRQRTSSSTGVSSTLPVSSSSGRSARWAIGLIAGRDTTCVHCPSSFTSSSNIIHPPTRLSLYEAPIFPGCAPTITRIALAQLASVPFSAGCTLYVPPARAANPDYRVLPYYPATADRTVAAEGRRPGDYLK